MVPPAIPDNDIDHLIDDSDPGAWALAFTFGNHSIQFLNDASGFDPASVVTVNHEEENSDVSRK